MNYYLSADAAQHPGPKRYGGGLLALLLGTAFRAYAQTAPANGTTSFTGAVNNATYVSNQASGTTAANVANVGWDFTLSCTGNIYVSSPAGSSAGQYGALGSGDPFIYCRRAVTTDNVLYCQVKPNNGAAFKLTSVYLTMSATTAPRTLTLTGYKNGSPVSGATLSQVISTNFTWVKFDVSANTAFQSIDEFRSSFPATTVNYQASLGVDEITIVAAAPLPVELVEFTAQSQGEAAHLSWVTASELNSAYFEVQASADGTAFRSLGQVAAIGSSSTRHRYDYLDASLPSYGRPQVYYRLRQMDQDGTASYSPVRVVAARDGVGLAVYPSPAHDYLMLVRPAGAAAGAAQLRDALGRVVRQVALATTNTETRLDLGGLAPGVYVLALPGQGLTRRVVVE